MRYGERRRKTPASRAYRVRSQSVLGAVEHASEHSHTVFNIAWLNDKVLDISTIEYGKCVKCLAGSFEGGWRYAQKW
jgi:hypothetical protein